MPRTDTIGRAGEHYVAAKLNSLGVYASPFSGNVPGIDIVATDSEQNHIAHIQVKSSSKRTWFGSLRHGWDIPKEAKECYCLGSCDAALCAKASVKVSPHCHHGSDPDEVGDLLTLSEVPGKSGHYWVFVSLEELRFWVIPDCTVRDEVIRKPVIEYLEERGGHRPGPKHGSLEMRIYDRYISPWLGCWSALGLGLEDSAP